MRRGIFILLEGVDRCGKSTQCKLLTENLNKKNIATESIRYPDRETEIGQIINNYLQKKVELDDHVIHLLYSANRWEFDEKVKEKMRNGINIICDRYAYSGVAFSAAKGLDIEWCKQPDKGLIKPDVVFFLNIGEEEAAKREGFGGERYEKKELQKKVKDIYLNHLKEDDWIEIDANNEISKINERLLGLIEQNMAKIETEKTDIQRLFE